MAWKVNQTVHLHRAMCCNDSKPDIKSFCPSLIYTFYDLQTGMMLHQHDPVSGKKSLVIILKVEVTVKVETSSHCHRFAYLQLFSRYLQLQEKSCL